MHHGSHHHPQAGATCPARARYIIRWRCRLLAAVAALLATATAATAQDEPEYRMEVGGAAGVATYQGDLNGSLLHQPQPRGAVTAKYKMNPRSAWSAAIGFTQLKGSTADADTWYPVLTEHPATFKTTLTDLEVRYEYNFWAYGTGREYHGARPLTAFITFGAGLAWANSSVKGYPDTPDPLYTDPETLLPVPLPDVAQLAPHDGSAVAFQVPLGLGVKYKVAPRLNITAEWVVHFTGSDRLDGLRDPYGIKSSGLFKNTDGYTTLQVAVTYDIWAKCKTCHSDRDDW